MAPPGVTRGALLDDRYRLEDVLGQGGMAVVYRAHDVVLGRDVAIKLFPAVAEDADERHRHQTEMQALAQLSHPGLVTLHDAGSAQGDGPTDQTYLVMELVEGKTLGDRIKEGPVSPRLTARLGRQVAEALAVVHAADVVHRDVKPANILVARADGLSEGPEVDPDAAVTTGPIVKLADFGIARLADGARLTVTGTTLGTASYLSPEQAAGGAVGPPTDVYALGLVLLECLTGHKAFTGTVMEVAAARLTSSPPIPPELGPEWVDLLRSMTERDPHERITAAQAAVRLTTLAGEVSSPSAADPSGPAADEIEESGKTRLLAAVGVGSGRAPRGPRRPRRAAVAGAVGVVALAGLLTTQLDRPGPATTETPDYPAVDGPLGEALETLQGSVEP